jgi:F-type H+-transporting ATPase subunit delta
MKNKALIRLYTRGLVHAIRDEEELGEIDRQLQNFQNLLREHKDLNLALTSSLLSAARKQAVADEVFERTPLHPKAKRFIHLLVKNHRLAILEDLVNNLPEMWNEEKGILSFDVASAVPLSEGQAKKLKEKLERLEKRPVHLKYRIDPDLIGGLSLRQGNIIYDASLRGALIKLKEKISEG